MPSEPAINPTAAALLGLLAIEAMSGYQLNQRAAEVFGDFWTVTRSQIYRELAGLERSEYVVAGEPGPRARRPYSITARGRELFDAWVHQMPATETIRFPLLLTMTFGSWVGRDRLLEFAAAQRPAHEERLASYEQMYAAAHAGGGDAAYVAATTAFGRHYERAVLAWMDDLPGILDAATTEGDGSA